MRQQATLYMAAMALALCSCEAGLDEPDAIAMAALQDGLRSIRREGDRPSTVVFVTETPLKEADRFRGILRGFAVKGEDVLRERYESFTDVETGERAVVIGLGVATVTSDSTASVERVIRFSAERAISVRLNFKKVRGEWRIISRQQLSVS